jgi:PTS system galactitol-specific IIA component
MTEVKQEYFHKELILAPMRAESAEDAITQLGALLQKGGFVRESFVPAVIKREKEFATGLPTAEVGVAIPHTDVEHVLKPAIAVGVLEKPVEFVEMGNPEGRVQVQIVCLLAIPEPDKVIPMLQSLVRMFQSPPVLHQIANSRSAAEIIDVFHQHCQVE